MAASKLKQILQLEPKHEITFEGPFERVVTSYLELKNPSDKKVCFKVKTTAPKRYCVRPNSGILAPDGKVKIAIMLQPLGSDGEAEARTKHKFMVQSTILESGDEDHSLDVIWSVTKQESIMDSKLRCVFISPDQQDGDGSLPETKKQNSGVVFQMNIGSEPLHRSSAATSTTYQAETVETKSSGDDRQSESISTSTPIAQRVTSSPSTKQPGSSSTSSSATQNFKFGQSAANKSFTSSHNLTSSFMQPMSDDYKIVLVSLAMLVLGVILGKYII